MSISSNRVNCYRKSTKLGRLFLGAWLLAGAFVASALAQEAVALTRISATASDAVFRVDGQPYQGAAVFSWPTGSKHTLEIADWQLTPPLLKGRYLFQHWSTALGQLASPSPRVTVTADPGIAWYRADVTTEYAVSLVFFVCEDGPCAYPGTIWVNQVACRQSGDVWLAAGTTVLLEAIPDPGFVFAGWTQGGNPAAIYSFALNAPMTVYPRFAVARRMQLRTAPDGLQLLADRGLVTAPIDVDWGVGSVHTLAPVSPQFDQHGRQWIFHSWNDGADRNRTYPVPAGPPPLSVVAQFVPAVTTLLLTEPPNLILTVDGSAGASPRYEAWAAGESHTVIAPTHQIDAAGGAWSFREWSAGKANAQAIQVTEGQASSGIRMTAFYDPLSRVHVDSIPTGLTVTVDGEDCHTPCDVERPVGTTIRLGARPSIAVSDGTRLDLGSWEGVAGVTFTTSAGYTKVTAHYQWSYRLSLGSSPAGSGSWRLSPPSSDGYYPAGTSVGVAIEPPDGMKFREWGGDLSGSANPSSIIIGAPSSVVAYFDSVPKIPHPARITNSAGGTASDAVAAGSIASLFGDRLSETTATGLTDPLPQSLGGVSLVCSGRLLPLLFVSPTQINFQVPSDLKPGKYQVEWHYRNAAVLPIGFTVTRSAPGLFAMGHRNGTSVSTESPAHPGEEILLYGTGFGPYQPSPLDGFRVPATPLFPLVDPVAIMLNGRTVAAESSAAAVGVVGLAVVTFRVPDGLDISAPINLALQIGDTVSNTIPLLVNR